MKRSKITNTTMVMHVVDNVCGLIRRDLVNQVTVDIVSGQKNMDVQRTQDMVAQEKKKYGHPQKVALSGLIREDENNRRLRIFLERMAQ